MNRRAKRNKYKKQTIEYNRLKNEYESYLRREAFLKDQKQRETVTISSMLFSEDVLTTQCVLGRDKVDDLRKHELVKNIAMNLSSNMQLFKKVPCDFGTRFDLQIVIPKD